MGKRQKPLPKKVAVPNIWSQWSLGGEACRLGLCKIREGIEDFFSATSSIANLGTGVSAYDFLRRSSKYFANKYREFKRNGMPDTYEEYVRADDPMPSLQSMNDSSSVSKIFVLIYNVIQSANLMRNFGRYDEKDGAIEQIKLAEALIIYATSSASDAARKIPRALITKVDGLNSTPLSDTELANLRLRIDIVHAQTIRQKHGKEGWLQPEVHILLMRVKYQAGIQRDTLQLRFAHFQQIMCRIHVARSENRKEDEHLALRDLEQLESEYDKEYDKEYDRKFQWRLRMTRGILDG